MDLESVYDIEEELGRGTFGVVRKCVHKKTKEVVAIKEISFELNSEGEDMTSKEIRICRKLQHYERIVRLEDVIYCENYVYLVFEYLSGGDLFDSILARNWYSEKEARQLARQILEAIQYCHKMRIVHRDLKPDNLLVCKPCTNGEIPQLKLTDFGIACEIPDGSDFISCDMTGSPMYMAPERILEKPSGCGVDVWSCGVIIFVLLAGYPPFWSEDVETLFLRIVHGNYSFHSPYWSKASNDVKDLIRQMLEVNPMSRISAGDALKHPWFQTSDLSSDNQEKMLKTLEAFNSRRKLKSIALVLIARKRFSSNVSTKLEKDRKRRTSTSYIPDKELENYTRKAQRKLGKQEIPENNPVESRVPKVLKVSIRVSDR